jgi:uncharacterized protein
MSNRLISETSPYLLQHADNPVDWFAWGEDALQLAQHLNKPILLSVGYAACHWCHIMAHESFEDPETAAVMNELFVNIKVDREERPDIDQIYMSALHLLGQRGGWPLTMFLTPTAEPIWGGTYFPKEARFGKFCFVDVLREAARLFREEPGIINERQKSLLSRLSTRAKIDGKTTVTARDVDNLASQLVGMMDPVNGGLRGAPKFPNTLVLEMLWRAGARTGEVRFFDLVDRSLERMCRGGIYDHLGGGFARYCVDDRWLVPHFEKMLYDNAQILELLALEYLRSGTMLYHDVADEIVGWLTREMTSEGGAFAASLDADSQGEEGRFYVWTIDEISNVLGKDDATLFASRYDVTAMGNFDSKNILNRLTADGNANMTEDAHLARLRAKLLEARQKRVRPNVDDKILSDWNGLMIAALVNSGIIFNRPAWIELATRAFDFISSAMTKADRLGHAWRGGRLLFPGLASDFAAMIRAALTLHEQSGSPRYLELALSWQHALDRHYFDHTNNAYFLTADDAPHLVVRPHATADDAMPNHNAVAAQNLIRLAVLAGDNEWKKRADRLFDGLLPAAMSDPFAHVALFNALDFRLRAAEIVVSGREERSFAAAALSLPFVERIVLRAPSAAALPLSHPAQEKIQRSSEGAAFICIDEACSMPVINVAQIAETFNMMRKSKNLI